MNEGNVSQFPQRPIPAGNGGGNGTNYRLQALEEDVREIKQDLREINTRLNVVEKDLAGIRERLNHTATKAWVLGGVLSGMGIAGAIGVGLARLLSIGGG